MSVVNRAQLLASLADNNAGRITGLTMRNWVDSILLTSEMITGAWSSSTAYVVNQTVTLGGVAYFCITNNTNHTPPDATYWVPFFDSTTLDTAISGLQDAISTTNDNVAARLPLTGGTMSGDIDMGNNQLTRVEQIVLTGAGNIIGTSVTIGDITEVITGSDTQFTVDDGSGTFFFSSDLPVILDVGGGTITNATIAQSLVTGLATSLSGKAASGANTDITSLLLNQTGLVVKGGSANALTIKPNETLSAARALNIVTGDATRTLTFAGNATISGTNSGDQTITLTGGVTGSGTGSFAATVVTNANLTGPITSVGNSTSIAAQTGTGTTFVMSASPTITGTLSASTISAPAGTSGNPISILASPAANGLGAGQDVTITGGQANTDAVLGGNVNIVGGLNNGGASAGGGNITIKGGVSSGSNGNGSISLQTAAGVTKIQVGTNGIGFFGVSVVAQQGATISLETALSNLGLRASGSSAPLAIAQLTIADASNIVLGSTTGTKIGTATTQKIGFFNATPVVQQTGDVVTALGNLGLVTSGTVALATNATTLQNARTICGQSFNGSANITITEDIAIIVDGAGAVLTTGSKGFRQIGFACTIVGWTLLGDQSGSIAIDIKKSTYASFPTTSSIVASAAPSITTAQKNTSTTLTGWTTSISAGDVVEISVTSVTSLTRCVIQLQVTR